MAIDMGQLLGAGVGAGSRGAVAGIVGGMAPQVGVGPDVVTAGVGYIMADRLRGFWADFGMGVLIGAIGDMVRTPIEGIVSGLPLGGAAAPAAEKNAQGQGGASPANDVDAYLAAKYGIAA